MTYALLENNKVVEYPVFAGDIQLRFPNTSFSIPFEPPDGYVSVTGIPQPSVDYTKNISEGTPVLLEDGWTQVWNITDATPEEITKRTNNKGQEIRGERNKRLAECDWTQLIDAPLDPDAKLAWQLYREALRMVPQQTGFPWEINWPPKPGA